MNLIFQSMFKKNLAIIAAVVGLSLKTFAGVTNTPPSLEIAYTTVANAPVFAMGGSGIGGSISEAELAFRVIQSSTNAAASFIKLTKEDRPVANLYGLAGLRLVGAKGDFKKHAARFKSSTSTVLTTLDGLIIEDGVTNVIARIGSGGLDFYLSPPKMKPKQQ